MPKTDLSKLAYPWEGPLTYVRQQTVRGSAAGSNDERRHRMVGYNDRAQAFAGCGVTFRNEVLSRKPIAVKGDLLNLCDRPGCFPDVEITTCDGMASDVR
jgi:hypothetical protein